MAIVGTFYDRNNKIINNRNKAEYLIKKFQANRNNQLTNLKDKIYNNEDYINERLYMNDLDKIRENNKNTELMLLEEKYKEFDPNLRIYSNEEYLKRRKEIEDKYKVVCRTNKRMNISSGYNHSHHLIRGEKDKKGNKPDDKLKEISKKNRLEEEKKKKNKLNSSVKKDSNVKKENKDKSSGFDGGIGKDNKEKIEKEAYNRTTNFEKNNKIDHCSDIEYFSDTPYDHLIINNPLNMEIINHKQKSDNIKVNNVNEVILIGQNQNNYDVSKIEEDNNLTQEEKDRNYYLDLQHKKKYIL